MPDLDKYVFKIKSAKNPVKEALIIEKETCIEYLYALLNHAIHIADWPVAQIIFFSMKVNLLHEVNLMSLSEQEYSHSLSLK